MKSIFSLSRLLRSSLDLFLGIYHTVFLLILGSSNITCHKSPQITEDIQPSIFRDGEKLTYSYFRNDSLIGISQMTVYFDSDDEIPIYCLVTITEYEMLDDYISDSSVVYFRRDNFQPIWSYRLLETDFGWTATETHYSETDIDVWFETLDGKETFDLSLSTPYFDSEMLLALLRAVQFKKSKEYTFNVFNPLMLTMVQNKVRYCARTMLALTKEFIECDKLRLSTLDNEMILFYEHQLPRRLIKFQEKKSNIVAVIMTE